MLYCKVTSSAGSHFAVLHPDFLDSISFFAALCSPFLHCKRVCIVHTKPNRNFKVAPFAGFSCIRICKSMILLDRYPNQQMVRALPYKASLLRKKISGILGQTQNSQRSRDGAERIETRCPVRASLGRRQAKLAVPVLQHSAVDLQHRNRNFRRYPVAFSAPLPIFTAVSVVG